MVHYLEVKMGWLALILIILAVVLFVPGLIVGTLKFLIWVGIILAAAALIIYLVRYLRGSRT